MYTELPTMQDLFVQLGLDSSEQQINSFIEKHRGLNDSRHIEDAPFWNDSQAEFLRGALLEDAEWAEVIDQLNVQLHQH
ncbi:DUF2789 domain-containing protein [Alteromonas sp. ASW11-130]|uniref:DUF2789 domain-containing protein n=1 Tax=Alteromonas sp. ASW11-130 TaxID=3015775 RepID=UPI002241F8CC|nr:DUF2789 domain-containing protein [Alteromonas sp. ASW11-130]MCW8090266.1 DUF2789 domain-containing protein [Alteromonas sp. ASW11-130]